MDKFTHYVVAKIADADDDLQLSVAVSIMTLRSCGLVADCETHMNAAEHLRYWTADKPERKELVMRLLTIAEDADEVTSHES